MPQKIGNKLKECRIGAGKSVREASEYLLSMGFKASEKTIYSWERDNSQPTPDALLALCEYYGIGDILQTFGYPKKSFFPSKVLNPLQRELITAIENMGPSQLAATKAFIGYLSAEKQADVVHFAAFGGGVKYIKREPLERDLDLGNIESIDEENECILREFHERLEKEKDEKGEE